MAEGSISLVVSTRLGPHINFYTALAHVPKPTIATVRGYAIGGGHVLHLVCDITIASENARFGQNGPRVGSFNPGWGITGKGDTPHRVTNVAAFIPPAS